MKRILTLALFPLLGLALIAAALLWTRPALRLRFGGQEAPGRVIGMVLQRADHADLVAGLDAQVALVLADGTRIEAASRDLTLVEARLLPAAGEPRSLDPLSLDPRAAAGNAALSPELRRVLDDAVRGDATAIRWALRRESRRPEDPRRVVRVEKTETVRGWFGLPAVPEVLSLRDGRIILAPGDPHAGTVETAAVFDRSDPAALEAGKGDPLVRYERRRRGEPETPEKRNFFLAAEPYATEFRPVFGFRVDGIEVARLSHIGRHGGPTLALRLFGTCRVYFNPARPAEAILVADPGAVEGAPLAWFSRYCEGLFGQWGAPALVMLAGSVFVVVGLLLISLAVRPSVPLAPD